MMKVVRSLANTLHKFRPVSVLALLMVSASLLFATALNFVPAPAYGYNISGPCSNAPGSTYCQEAGNTSDPVSGSNGTMVRIVTMIATGAGIAAVIIILLAGMSYVTSQGDPAKAQAAKNTIIYALIGLIVIISAAGIISLVLSKI